MPGDLLTWPAVGGGHVLFIVLFLVGVVTVFACTRWVYIRAGRRDARWSVLMQDALRHRVRREDLKILRNFFDRLAGDETLRVIGDRRFFHSRLHDYLLARPILRPQDVRRRVRLFESMFPAADFEMEVKSLRDLQPGEVCSLEFSDLKEPRLATILRRGDGQELWLGVPDWHPTGGIGESERVGRGGDRTDPVARIYVYRPSSGGFLIQGRILRVGKETVVFGDVERIESHGEQHLMAAIEAPLSLRPWPPAPLSAVTDQDAETVPEVDAGVSATAASNPKADERASVTPASNAKTEAQGPASAAESAAPPVRIEGVSKLVSDRALLFFTSDQAEAHDYHLLEGQEVWEIDLVLPRGFAFRCRGVVMPSGKGGRGRWLFKYLDATEGQRRALFEEIKRAGAKRERLV